MPGLSIIVAIAEGRRFYAALEAAMASAALGRPARIFLQGDAVRMVQVPIGFAGDHTRTAAGQPDLASMIAEAAAMEVEMFVCQSGMALVGMAATELTPHATAAGLVSFLRDVGQGDQLVVY